jgi:HEAT repeat protein
MKNNISSVLKKLKSNQKHIIIEGIQQFSDSGKAEFLEEVISLLINTKDVEIRELIMKLLFEIKDQSAVPVLVNAINDNSFKCIKKTLLLACWQSGLDFSEYLPVFTEIIRTSDIETGLEAFSVAENFTENSSLEMIDKEIILTEAYLEKQSNSNNILAVEILKVLKDMKKGKI